MTTAAHVVDVRRYTQEYERLRSQVNGLLPSPALATPPARGIGLALLLRDGLPAWLRAVRQVLSEVAASAGAALSPALLPAHGAPPVNQAPSPADDGDGTGVSMSSSALVEPARQRDITSLLASLVLSARRTADAASIKEPDPCH